MQILVDALLILAIAPLFDVCIVAGREAARSYWESLQRTNPGPIEAGLGFLLLGGLTGIVLTMLLPHRVLPQPVVPGLSLVFAPVALGIAMHGWGRVRRNGGHRTSRLATFWGGAAFAFGAAIARFHFVR